MLGTGQYAAISPRIHLPRLKDLVNSVRLTARPNRLGFAVAVFAGLLIAVVISICVGGAASEIGDVWHALVTPTGTDLDVTIRDIRVPRTLLGIVVGACLGLAGTLIQGHTRNPIADPGLLGIFQGAALAIVAVTAFGGNPSGLVLALAAFAGALIASVLVFVIASSSRNGATPITLVLAGVAVSALFSALVTGIVLFNLQSLDALRFWQVGSLASRNGAIGVVWPFILAGAVLAFANIAPLNALALGEDTARSLGVSPLRSRSLGIAAITLLAGCAVMLAGPIAFAGLIVPHLARAIGGADYRWSVPLSAVLGSTVLLLADTVGRIIARPGELSAAVVLAVVGAPFFMVLARRRKLVTL